MGYEYRDESRAADPHALPDIEVWSAHVIECSACGAQYPHAAGEPIGSHACPECSTAPTDEDVSSEPRYWYAAGLPGCLHDGPPIGPFDTEAEALEDAREDAAPSDD